MKYYALFQSSKYKTLVDKGEALDFYNAVTDYSFEGDSSALSLKEFDLEFNPDDRRKQDKSDLFASFRPALVVTTKALEVFNVLVPGTFEKIRVNSPNSDHQGILITALVDDALDRELAEFDEYDQGLVVYKYVLKEAALKSVDVFRLKESPISLFVSERFLILAKKNKLLGLEFREIQLS